MIEVGPERGLEECLVDCLLTPRMEEERDTGQLLLVDGLDANVSQVMGDRSVTGEMGDAGREE